ncbi:putative hybrid sensor histdine kinase [Feldmannia species virus]|uniref:histidine kinase n=1 Tax=Feldmannia species virus TaxID=39420 RepID=B5LWN0_9PHYC|nr:putative hybrid sensor histdine kinase [Feldmannia species virus]ACH46893.1 putative hybrid sensor histdine kinase [Feldmannia species virus]
MGEKVDALQDIPDGMYGIFYASPGMTREGKLHPLNINAVRVLGEDSSDIQPTVVHVIGEDSLSKILYGTTGLCGIPVKLQKLWPSTDGFIVQIFLASTKASIHPTDFTKLGDLATDGFWEWYPVVDYEYMSNRFWSILGYSQKDMDESPSSWQAKIEKEDHLIALKTYEDHIQSRGKKPYYVRARYRHRNGHQVQVVCRGSVIEWLPDGRPWKLFGTHTDVTTIVMRDALAQREKFVSRMSHEIRSPLCAVLNECDSLGDNHNLDGIRDACAQMIYIANDILELQKMNSDEMKVAKNVRCCPEEVINLVAKRHRREIRKKGLRLSVSVGDLPDDILVDVPKFNQIVDNLISNSIKYTDKGRISIDCDFDDTNSTLVTRIEDTGVGIPDKDRASIFDEFYQGSTSMRGIGIGLHIVTSLCRLLGGMVEVESSVEGKGTTMCFRLPVEKPCAHEFKNDSPIRGLRVLIVDDMKTNISYIHRKLAMIEEELNFKINEVVEALDGSISVSKFKQSKKPFDLVLMDCLMPIMDGFEATKKIHQLCDDRNQPRVPVIAVTASVSNTIGEDCGAAGMSAVVTKPFTTADFCKIVQKYIT